MGRLVAHGWDYQAAKDAHGQLVPGAGGRERGRDGHRLLVLRRERGPDDLPGAARARAQAGRRTCGSSSLTGAGGAHGGHGAGRDPGAAEERGLAVQGAARGRVDRPDQPRAHQPRDRAHHARRGRPAYLVPPRSAARRRRAGSVNRCFWLLLGGSLAFYATALYLGFHEGHLVVARGPHARAGRGRHRAAPVPDHGRRDRDARRLLDAALARRALDVEVARARSARSSSPAAAPSRSARSRGRCRPSRRSTSCSTAAATRAT